MNRVHPPHASNHFSPHIAPANSRSLLSRDSQEHAGQSLFIPEHYEPNYAYPFLLWLHGQGDDEQQLFRIMPGVSLRNFIAVGLRGTRTFVSSEGGPESFGWSQDQVDIEQAGLRAFEAVEQMQSRFNIAPDRLFIAGYDDGGTMALRLALLHPEAFAGALSIGGPLPEGDTPLRSLEQARHLPLLLGHGRTSQKYDESRVCEDLRLLHTAGVNITVRQYPCGDELTDQMLGDANRWMMEQVTGVPAIEEETSYLDCVSRN